MTGPATLTGRRIIITRPREQAEALEAAVRRLGGAPVVAPAIAIEPPGSWLAVDAALRGISAYDWVAFTSANAVRTLAERARELGISLPSGSDPRLAAVGPATAAALSRHFHQPDVVAETHTAEAMGSELAVHAGTRVLFPRGDLARDTLPEVLRSRGAIVDEIVAYRTVAAPGASVVAETMASNAADAVLFASPSAVRFVADAMRSPPGGLALPAVFCIGPATADAARDAGFGVSGTAPDATAEALIEAVARFLGPAAPYPRPRRMRRTPALRSLVRETDLRAGQLIHPVFVREGTRQRSPIVSMPGHAQVSVDLLDAELDELVSLGIEAVLLFGIPAEKDASGTGAWAADGPVPRAIDAIRRRHPTMVVVADVCLCEYTSHGHCGIVDHETGRVLNDATLPLLARAAVAYAAAGADLVAPSAMMDSQVAVIRSALDGAGHADVAILAYAVKHASAFYGPFREAAQSAPSFGDRRGYQMDPANAREALREAELDVAEGADVLMVKPAGMCLDIIARVRAATHLPVAAYQVSGEFAMLKAAAERGWIDERRAVLESLFCIRRAGADIIVTYYAKDVAGWLRNGDVA